MADFLTAFKRTAVFEGGYSDNADDNGNWTGGKKGVGVLVGTKYGITAVDMFNYLKKTPTVSDMKNLSIEVAQKIYKNKYWDVVNGDKINNQDEANMIYDTAVNMGCSIAIKLIQRSFGLAETGHFDDTTLEKLNNKS